jgi:GTP-binding protein EngB required for normal cell division
MGWFGIMKSETGSIASTEQSEKSNPRVKRTLDRRSSATSGINTSSSSINSSSSVSQSGDGEKRRKVEPVKIEIDATSKELIISLNMIQASIRKTDANEDGLGLKDLEQLPQIIVLGGQSSGKSSVLESLMGRTDVFPTDQNICTKMPLRLELTNDPNSTGENVTFVNFKHQKNAEGEDQTFPIGELADKVRIHTESSLTEGQGVSDEEIKIMYESPNVVTQTLIDIPGLVQKVTKGQDAKVPEKIKKMAITYASNENSIILAINEACVDLVRSQGFQIAEQVDPEGKRTLGVITKCDVILDGSEDNLRSLVENESEPLELGYVAVVNLSPAMKKSNTTFQQLRENEKFILRKNLGTKIAENHGGEVLSRRISQLLAERVAKFLPEYENKLKEKAIEAEKDLKKYQATSRHYDSKGKPNYGRIMQDKLRRLENDMKLLTGEKANSFSLKIRDLLQQTLQTEVKRIYDDKKGNWKVEIEEEVRNMAPLGTNIFPSNNMFKALLQKSVDDYPEIALDCVMKAFKLLDEFTTDVISSVNSSGNPQFHDTVMSFFWKSTIGYGNNNAPQAD